MIVLSYRRADSAGLTRALHERLARELGPEHVFIDVDAIEGGDDFRERLTKAIASSDALVVVIGPRWMTGDTEASRLSLAEDVVRLEVRTALRCQVRILPVLVDGAPMPERSALPEDVRALADRNALRLRNESFEADVEGILEAVTVRPPALTAYGPLALASALAVAYVLLAWRWRFYPAGLAVAAAALAAALFLAARARLARSGSAARLLGTGLVVGAGALVVLAGWFARERRLAEPFTLAMRIQDSRGGPVRQGTIHLAALDRTAGVADGEASFPGVVERLVGRTLEVRAVADGYEPMTASVTIPDTHVVTLRLEPRRWATPVRGRVVDKRMRGLAGVRLDFGSGLAAATSGADGSFEVTLPLAPGTTLTLRTTLDEEECRAPITVPEHTPLEVPFPGRC